MLNDMESNIKFTMDEYDTEKGIPFLDILIKMEGKKLSTTIYRKPSDTLLTTKFNSNIPKRYKIGLIGCKIIRVLRICSDWRLLDNEIKYVKEMLGVNGFPVNIIDSEIERILDKWQSNGTRKVSESVLENENCKKFLKIPYENEASLNFRNKITTLFSKFWGSEVKGILIPKNKLGKLIKNKQNGDMSIASNLAYLFTCPVCQEIYVGKTARHVSIRIGEHISKSWKTGKEVKASKTSAISEHRIKHDYLMKFDKSCFNILKINSSGSWLGRKVLEALLIRNLRPSLNNQIAQEPYLF